MSYYKDQLDKVILDTVYPPTLKITNPFPGQPKMNNIAVKEESAIEICNWLVEKFPTIKLKCGAFHQRDEVEIIEDYKWLNPRATKIIRIKNKKFKILYDNSNGWPLGFNSKWSASVMKDDGTWHYVAEKNDIGYKGVSYVCSESERKRDSEQFIKEMEEYLTKIYK